MEVLTLLPVDLDPERWAHSRPREKWGKDQGACQAGLTEAQKCVLAWDAGPGIAHSGYCVPVLFKRGWLSGI